MCEDGPGGDGVEVEGGLGVEGVVELFFGSVPHELGEGEGEEGICLVEELTGDGVRFGKFFAHAEGL